MKGWIEWKSRANFELGVPLEGFWGWQRAGMDAGGYCAFRRLFVIKCVMLCGKFEG